MIRRPHLATLIALAALSAQPALAVQRVFVSSSGSDANTATNCGFTAPCRGFTAAMTVVDSGGEVVALDAAGYGAVTITKSVSIVANPGFYAGISASTGSAVTIATAGVKVILRGLNINGLGAAYGVEMSNGTSLAIENCVVSNFSSRGVSVTTAATVRIVDSTIRDSYHGAYFTGGSRATVSGSRFFGNTDAAIYAYANPAATTTLVAVTDSVFTNPNVSIYGTALSGLGTVKVTIARSSLVNNGYGPTVDAGTGAAIMTVSESIVTGNNVGYYNNGATLESLGNNTFRSNISNTGAMVLVGLQ